MTSNINRIADNAALTVLARGAMFVTPILLSIIAYLASNSLEAASIRVAAVEISVQHLSERTTAIEASRVEARNNAVKQNDQVLQRLDRLEAATTELAKAVSALTAVMQTMQQPRPMR